MVTDRSLPVLSVFPAVYGPTLEEEKPLPEPKISSLDELTEIIVNMAPMNRDRYATMLLEKVRPGTAGRGPGVVVVMEEEEV